MSFLDFVVYLGLGVLLLFGFQYANRFNKAFGFDWRAWVFATISILLITLALAWAYASFSEHEIQAGWVGLLVFGVLGIVFAFLTTRVAGQSQT
jgi:hypothetical protein